MTKLIPGFLSMEEYVTVISNVSTKPETLGMSQVIAAIGVAEDPASDLSLHRPAREIAGPLETRNTLAKHTYWTECHGSRELIPAAVRGHSNQPLFGRENSSVRRQLFLGGSDSCNSPI